MAFVPINAQYSLGLVMVEFYKTKHYHEGEGLSQDWKIASKFCYPRQTPIIDYFTLSKLITAHQYDGLLAKNMKMDKNSNRNGNNL